jgi:heme A synthase
MSSENGFERFARFAWGVLGYNLVVILWGVFLRASKSGDGCGQHWLTCGGEVVPSAPELKTIIEFSHRLTSAAAGIVIIALVIWAVLIYRRERTDRSRNVLLATIASFVLVAIEGLIGAGLVLTGNTAETLTPARPFWMAAHLINTSVLLAALTLTAWLASNPRRLAFNLPGRMKMVLLGGVLLLLGVGLTGSVAALASMIFPAETLTEGIARDFSPTSHFLLRVRPFHPLISALSAVYLIFAASWIRREASEKPGVARKTSVLSWLLVAQVALGLATLLMLAPIVMQLGHLLLADLIWITFVLIALELFAVPASE